MVSRHGFVRVSSILTMSVYLYTGGKGKLESVHLYGHGFVRVSFILTISVSLHTGGKGRLESVHLYGSRERRLEIKTFPSSYNIFHTVIVFGIFH